MRRSCKGLFVSIVLVSSRPARGPSRGPASLEKVRDRRLEKSRLPPGLDPPRGFLAPVPPFLVGIEESRLKTIGTRRLPRSTSSNRTTRKCFMAAVQEDVRFAPRRVHRRGRVGRSFKPIPFYNAYNEADLDVESHAYEVGRNQLVTRFRERVAAAAKEMKPTHLVVYVTGWNNTQAETVCGMNNIHKYVALAAASGGEFRPLMVGISWPSMSEVWGKFLGKTTYPVKSSDADEVGLLWACTLVSQVLAPVRDDLATADPARRPKLVVIGHSFGEGGDLDRVQRRPRPRRDSPDGPPARRRDRPSGGLLVATVSRRRGGRETYPSRGDRVRFAYTCSSHDLANASVLAPEGPSSAARSPCVTRPGSPMTSSAQGCRRRRPSVDRPAARAPAVVQGGPDRRLPDHSQSRGYQERSGR